MLGMVSIVTQGDLVDLRDNNTSARSQLSRSTMRQSNYDIISCMGRTKPIVSADYIVGITDGEGCFYVGVSKSNAYCSGYKVIMHFHIKLQERDKELLEKIHNTFECGNVYFQKEQRINHTQCYRYTVSAWRDIESIIIPFFIKHTLQTASKRKSFDTFCTIAKLVRQKEHLTQKGVRKILQLKKQMNKRTIGLA